MRNAKGFTLIELMIVVAVVAILAAVVLPSYREYIRKGRRAEAMQAVGEVRLALERWRAENPSYLGCGATCTSVTTATTFYTINLSGEDPISYTLTATPAGAQIGDRCGNLVVTRATKPTWSTASCN